MRLVIDLQGAQGSSRHRGIGRLSRELALAMARAPGRHEPVILLNEAMPEAADELSELFSALVPPENIRLWRGLTDCPDTGNAEQRARRRASEIIRAQMLSGLGADLVHVASMVEGAGDDVISTWPATLQRLPVAATFYDAIPLIQRDRYLLGSWREWGMTGWYMRQLQELRQCDALLAISESSRSEAIDYLGYDPERVHNMRAGFDAAHFRPVALSAAERAALLARNNLRDGFILFVGAGDIRKNDVGLVQAYALLPPALRQAHQLVISGVHDRDGLREKASRLGIAEQDLVLPRHLPEADLPALYSACRGFIMPSLHEGFGLPALEAMACGAAVIASNVTSLPEVVGLEEALFDPHEAASIAAALRRLLMDDAYHQRVARHGLDRASTFTWAESARRAWIGLEAAEERLRAADRRVIGLPGGAVLQAKPSLACVGPLPPAASGIADYTRDLLPDLARHYDITLVTATGQTDDDMLQSLFPVIDERRFAETAQRFDRILYQIGNSQFHSSIVETLMPGHPGVAVLHDVHLGNIPWVKHLQGGSLAALAQDLFDSDGWPALRSLAELGPRAATERHPCSMPVFRNALGVIQHSEHARSLVTRELGAEAAAMVRLVPHPRSAWPRAGRVKARRLLGLPAEAPVFATFGIVAETKRPLEVLEAWQTAMGRDAQARLAYVGGIEPELQRKLEARAAALGLGDRLIFTGRVPEETYRHWLDAADIALQFRAESRGETSGAIADALIVGLPVVANAHGSVAELPADAVLLLPDAAKLDIPAAGAAIAALWGDPARRAAQAASGQRHARQAMAPARVAALYRDAIEAAYAAGAPARLRAATPSLPANAALDAARALTISFPPLAPQRLLLDASAMWHNDLGTGIQRVIREIARHALLQPGHQAEMVRLDGQRLRYARPFAARLLGLPDGGLQDLPVSAGPRDTIVLMDNYGIINAAEVAELRRMRRQGARIVVVIYDILPVLHPEWFPPEAVPALHHWLDQSLGLADAAICISRSVAEELSAWLDTGAIGRRRPLDIGWFPLGSDFAPAVVLPGHEGQIQAALAAAGQRPSLLMVGTIEPRKGHADALDAFDKLWAAGHEIGLTIVGKAGWRVEALVDRLTRHPEAGRRLIWLREVGDVALAQLYAAHAGVLMASHGEGFGLPLVEAARLGRPVVARDLPVFREIAGDHALWFGTRPLAEVLVEWLEREAAGTLPPSSGIITTGWKDSSESLVRQLKSREWPMRWTPPEGG